MLRRINDEVFVAEGPIVSISSRDIEFLKEKLASAPRKRIRICAHATPEDRLHEMIIVLDADTYIRPHKHIGKSESFHIIDGSVDVVIFEDQGEIEDVVRMS